MRSKKGRNANTNRAARNGRNGRGRPPSGRALAGIMQGVGATVPRPFGGTSSVIRHQLAFDAFHHCHAPLPRAIGPYSIVRSTQFHASKKKLCFFGPFLDNTTSGAKWSNLAGVEFENIAQTVGTNGNVAPISFEQLSNDSWNAAQATPAAFSVQIMNPQAIQGTTGIVYLGRVRTALKLSDNLQTTVSTLANSLISYNNPRLCSAAKLAFNGVQIDLVPYNLSELANFTPLSEPSFTQYGASTANPYGFAPMFIYNPQEIPLDYLICCEWRVRFDPSNPAQATHIYHPPMSDSWWHQAQLAMEHAGNGVQDIASRVASIGNSVYGAMGTVYNVARGAQALRNVASPLLALGA